MFTSLIPINNILLAENGRTIPRHINLLAGTHHHVCFHGNSSFGFLLNLEKKKTIPKGSLAQVKDCSGVVLFSGANISDHQLTLTCDLTFHHPYVHATDDLVLELISPDEKVLASQPLKVKLYYSPAEDESDLSFRKGVPVEVLNFFNTLSTRAASISDESNEVQNVSAPLVPTISQLAYAVIGYIPPRYDTINGRSFFGDYSNWNNITFYQNAYVNAHSNNNSILNCYDCAAALQKQLEDNGYTVMYCYMNPFGYLAQTYLIGRGQCNNPFYNSTGGSMIVAYNNNNRTAFGNHAFVRVTVGSNRVIADACAGPHTGNETISQYISSATDYHWPNPPRVTRGTTADVGYYYGINTLYLNYPVTSNRFSDQINDPIFNAENVTLSAVLSQKVVTNLPAMLARINDAGWKVTYQETLAGEEEGLQILFFEKDGHYLYLRIYASKDNNQYTINRFFDLALNLQSPDHGLSKVADSVYHQHVESKNELYQLNIFQYYNVVVHVTTSDAELLLTDLVKSFAGTFQTPSIPSGSRKEVKVKHTVDKTTDQHRIDLLDADKQDVLEFIDVNQNLRILDCSDTYVVFEKTGKEKTAMKVWSMNTVNLGITDSQVVEIK